MAVVVSFDAGAIDEAGQDIREPATHILLHQVLVTDVQVENPGAVPQPSADPAQPSAVQTGQLAISVGLSAPDVERLVHALEYGRIWLAAEPENAPRQGTAVQSRGTIFR